MLRSRKEKQQGMEVVILEQMVPENHLLRKIDRSIDFSFINKLCAPLYSENVGRPAVDPEILFRMLFEAICTASARKDDWRKKSITTLPTNGFVVWG